MVRRAYSARLTLKKLAEVDMAKQAKIIIHNAEEVVEEIALIEGQVLPKPAMGGVTYEIRDVKETLNKPPSRRSSLVK